ncbi:MAG: SemiSWEET family sugar transporter [Chitinophagaceae bacterium]
MDWITVIGYLGVFLSSITFIPQVWQAWKTKSVGDLSFWMIIILLGNVSTWLFYGIYKGDHPIIVANSIILVLALLLFYFKLVFPKSKS